MVERWPVESVVGGSSPPGPVSPSLPSSLKEDLMRSIDRVAALAAVILLVVILTPFVTLKLGLFRVQQKYEIPKTLSLKTTGPNVVLPKGVIPMGFPPMATQDGHFIQIITIDGESAKETLLETPGVVEVISHETTKPLDRR